MTATDPANDSTIKENDVSTETYRTTPDRDGDYLVVDSQAHGSDLYEPGVTVTVISPTWPASASVVTDAERLPLAAAILGWPVDELRRVKPDEIVAWAAYGCATGALRHLIDDEDEANYYAEVSYRMVPLLGVTK